MTPADRALLRESGTMPRKVEKWDPAYTSWPTRILLTTCFAGMLVTVAALAVLLVREAIILAMR